MRREDRSSQKNKKYNAVHRVKRIMGSCFANGTIIRIEVGLNFYDYEIRSWKRNPQNAGKLRGNENSYQKVFSYDSYGLCLMRLIRVWMADFFFLKLLQNKRKTRRCWCFVTLRGEFVNRARFALSNQVVLFMCLRKQTNKQAGNPPTCLIVSRSWIKISKAKVSPNA